MIKSIATIKENVNTHGFQMHLKSNGKKYAKQEIKKALEQELNAYNRSVDRLLRLKNAVEEDNFKLELL